MFPKSLQDQSSDNGGRQNAPEKRLWDLRYSSHCPVGVEHVKRQCGGEYSTHAKVYEVIFALLFHLLKDGTGPAFLAPSLCSSSDRTIDAHPSPDKRDYRQLGIGQKPHDDKRTYQDLGRTV